jgi:5-methyltetrahydrofolate--homocysteine methyltransferase
MQQPVRELLRKGEVLVADGAMGTMLMQKGLKLGECPEAWNLKAPEALEDIARAYLEAGADIIQTNTFGGSPLKLGEYGLENQASEINRAAVRIVRKVVGDLAFVSGSCGPSGKILQPFGDADPESVYRSFEVQIRALVEEGVDLLCLETMTDLGELLLAVKAARAVAEDIPVMATMTFDVTPRGFYTIMGVSVRKAAESLAAAGAAVIGSNCGNGIEQMISIAREFRSFSSLPILIQANAGFPRMKSGAVQYPETPEFFAEKTPDVIKAGATIIGGCCGTTPAHIRAIRSAVGL